MKKIVLVIVLFLVFTSVAAGSSLNGDYKGNPIVIVKSNGVALQSDEVPAMIIDGHTMVPISLLRQIGVTVNWDQNTYSVDVSLPSQKNTSQNNNSNNSNNPINNSPVENGDNPNTFQFIGVNTYYSGYILHVSGQLKNVSGRKTSAVGIGLSVTFFDKDGLVVGAAGGRMGPLDIDETAPFDIPVFSPPKGAVRYEVRVKG